MLIKKTIFKWHEDLTLTWNIKEIKLKLQQELSNNLSNQCTSKWNDLYNMYCDGKGKLPLLMLENQIRQEKECGDEFKIRFALFFLGALLCPMMKVSVKSSFLHLLQDTASIKKINWAQIVFFFLVRGINDFKSKKRSSGISGCLFFLMVIHF